MTVVNAENASTAMRGALEPEPGTNRSRIRKPAGAGAVETDDAAAAAPS